MIFGLTCEFFTNQSHLHLTHRTLNLVQISLESVFQSVVLIPTLGLAAESALFNFVCLVSPSNFLCYKLTIC